MATATTNTPIDHSTDAGFRAWGSELSGMLATVGLVKTSDTGQINWTTATKPTTANGVAGYEIWRFADTLQSTAPIFIKIEYGSPGNANYPGVWITIGPGTNGAGSLTADYITRMPTVFSSAPAAGSYLSYVCHTEGALSICFKMAASASYGAVVGFVVSRPLDASGAWTGEGVALVRIGGKSTIAPFAQCYGFDAFFQSVQSQYYCLSPFQPTGTVIGADYQVFRAFGPFPRYRTIGGLFAGIGSELGTGVAVSVALEGSTAHSFMPLDDKYAAKDNAGAANAIIWE